MSYDELQLPGNLRAVVIPMYDDDRCGSVTFHDDHPDIDMQMQRYVGGDIDVIQISDDLSLYVNSKAKESGHPRNERATVLAAVSRPRGIAVENIHGVVLVFGGLDEQGNRMSIPHSMETRLLTL